MWRGAFIVISHGSGNRSLDEVQISLLRTRENEPRDVSYFFFFFFHFEDGLCYFFLLPAFAIRKLEVGKN